MKNYVVLRCTFVIEISSHHKALLIQFYTDVFNFYLKKVLYRFYILSPGKLVTLDGSDSKPGKKEPLLEPPVDQLLVELMLASVPLLEGGAAPFSLFSLIALIPLFIPKYHALTFLLL